LEVPDWVLYHVVGSKSEDWRLYKEGWIHDGPLILKGVRVAKGVMGVYVSCYDAVELIWTSGASVPESISKQ
jgi:hypothetical protein